MGCGHARYLTSVSAAESRVEQAQEMGAETYAPFEYYVARERLRSAKRKGADASYSAAASQAEDAELYAQKAIDTVRAARRDGRAGAR